METLETIIKVVLFLSTWTFTVYIWMFVFRCWAHILPEGLGHSAREMCREMRPVMLVAIPLNALHSLATQHNMFLKVLDVALHAFYLWFVIIDKDDRWKKRRKKLASKVKEIGGKLVIVPMPAPIPVGAS